MKKVFRIILLVLAVIAAPFALVRLYGCISAICFYLPYIIEDEVVLQRQIPYEISLAFVAFSAALFSIIYIVFTLKNGLGKTLYSSVALSIEDLKAEREQRKKERRKERISELEETLEQLKQEESE